MQATMSFFGGSFPKRMLCGEPKESRFPLAPYVHPAVQQKESKSTGAIWMCGSWTGAAGFWRLEPRQNWSSPLPLPRPWSFCAAAGCLAGWLARCGWSAAMLASVVAHCTFSLPFLFRFSAFGPVLSFAFSPFSISRFHSFLLAMGFFGVPRQS